MATSSQTSEEQNIEDAIVLVHGEPYRLVSATHAIRRWNRPGAPPDPKGNGNKEIRDTILSVLREWAPIYGFIPDRRDFTLPAPSGRFVCAKVDNEQKVVVAVTTLSSSQNRDRYGVRFYEEDLDLVKNGTLDDVADLVDRRVALADWERLQRRKGQLRYA